MLLWVSEGGCGKHNGEWTGDRDGVGEFWVVNDRLGYDVGDDRGGEMEMSWAWIYTSGRLRL